MRKELPVRPNLEHLKAQAKDLLDAYRRGEADAFERFRKELPAAHGADDERIRAMGLALHDAQSVIAREYGFSSFNELHAHVDAQSDASGASAATPASAAPSLKLLRALADPHLATPLPPEVLQALHSASAQPKEAIALPELLPIIPVRNALLAAGSTVPLNIGRPSSLAAVQAAERGEGLLAVFAQRDAGNEAPDERDLYAVGCAARLLKVVATSDRGTWIVLRVTEWVRLEALEQRSPFLRGRIAAFPVEDENTDAVRHLERNLRERVRGRMATLPDSEWLTAMTDRMTALELADTTIANLRCTVAEKAAYASEPSLVSRLEYVLALLERVA